MSEFAPRMLSPPPTLLAVLELYFFHYILQPCLLPPPLGLQDDGELDDQTTSL